MAASPAGAHGPWRLSWHNSGEQGGVKAHRRNRASKPAPVFSGTRRGGMPLTAGLKSSREIIMPACRAQARRVMPVLRAWRGMAASSGEKWSTGQWPARKAAGGGMINNGEARGTGMAAWRR